MAQASKAAHTGNRMKTEMMASNAKLFRFFRLQKPPAEDPRTVPLLFRPINPPAPAASWDARPRTAPNVVCHNPGHVAILITLLQAAGVQNCPGVLGRNSSSTARHVCALERPPHHQLSNLATETLGSSARAAFSVFKDFLHKNFACVLIENVLTNYQANYGLASLYRSARPRPTVGRNRSSHLRSARPLLGVAAVGCPIDRTSSKFAAPTRVVSTCLDVPVASALSLANCLGESIVKASERGPGAETAWRVCGET
ncbi:hypothetical protein C8R43DRAFT_1111191 [Mycena crocata]|nr:hypothetical protein C8R43DRAFT_1111191 [Mycena crocata]